jgi:hypothetical protein
MRFLFLKSTTTTPGAAFPLTLANASDKLLAVVDLPQYCSFSLESVSWAEKNWALAHNPCEEVFPSDFDVVILAPGQQRRFDFDFSTERWLVKDNDNVRQIGTLDRTEQFRIVYRPPGDEQCRLMSRQGIIWHGYLPSRAFRGLGQID